MVSWLSLKLTKCVHNFLIFSFHKDLMHCPLGRITLPLLREADERSRRADPALRGLAEGRGGSWHPWKTVGSVRCTEPWRIHGAFETQASLLRGLVVCSPVREGAGQAGPPPPPASDGQQTSSSSFVAELTGAEWHRMCRPVLKNVCIPQTLNWREPNRENPL